MRYIIRGDSPAILDTVNADGLTELDRARDYFVTNGHQNGFDFEIYKRNAVRNRLRTLFDGKCAYCEFVYDVGYTEDIEHFRPKARIDVATPAGIESIYPGYWWLGSSWDNLLPSCKRCNVAKWLCLYDGTKVKSGKSNFFPLDNEADRATTEGGEATETALLLNPALDDPADYLTFEIKDGHCIIVPKAGDPGTLAFRRARTSIDVYGLNRHRLVKQRTERYTDLKAAIVNLEYLIESYDWAPKHRKPAIAERLLDEKTRIKLSMASDTAHSAMAAWLSAPILISLGIIAP